MKLLFERIELLKWYARDFSDARQTIDLNLKKNTLALVVRISPEVKEILRQLMLIDRRKNYSEIIRQLILREGHRQGLIRKNKNDLVILTNLVDMNLLKDIMDDLEEYKKLNRKNRKKGKEDERYGYDPFKRKRYKNSKRDA